LRAAANQHAIDFCVANAPESIAQILHVTIAKNQRTRSFGDLDGASNRVPIRLAFVSLL